MCELVWKEAVYREIKRLKFVFYEPKLKKKKSLSLSAISIGIPAKPLHNYDIVSVHFNNFYSTVICDKLQRLRYVNLHTCHIYLNVDDCWLTYAMP